MADTADPKTKRTKIGGFPVKKPEFFQKAQGRTFYFSRGCGIISRFFHRVHLAKLTRSTAIISRVLDFCRRTLGSKSVESVAQPKKSRQSILPELKKISRDTHSVSRKDISPNALKVLYRLKDAGYEAYLVGGCIRDILLGLKPKDFDVVTNAHP
ncbi:MAG: hypothetical protein LDL40_11950, partial [Pararheinheimera sp.]|nr:hypothetical protein [Rheinheimera sp.]